MSDDLMEEIDRLVAQGSVAEIPATHRHIEGELARIAREHIKAAREVSDSYLRIRELVGAWDTKPGGVDRFEVTERRVKQAVVAAHDLAVGVRTQTERAEKATDNSGWDFYKFKTKWKKAR